VSEFHEHCLRYRRVLDLSHAIRPDIPVWPGDPRPVKTPVAALAEQGYALNQWQVGEHSGTHVGVAAHLHDGGLTVDRLPPEALIRPAVMLDVRSHTNSDPDYRLNRRDVLDWEQTFGSVPEGCLALLCTGWAERWNDPAAFLNADPQGCLHFPGFGVEAAELLIHERGVAGLGTDTHGVDPGNDATLVVNRLLLRDQRIHLECLANLEQLPPRGAVVFLGVLPLAGGSGSPARVLALVP